jgi:hypothetical protein
VADPRNRVRPLDLVPPRPALPLSAQRVVKADPGGVRESPAPVPDWSPAPVPDWRESAQGADERSASQFDAPRASQAPGILQTPKQQPDRRRSRWSYRTMSAAPHPRAARPCGMRAVAGAALATSAAAGSRPRKRAPRRRRGSPLARTRNVAVALVRLGAAGRPMR